jgi:hypothetical protein
VTVVNATVVGFSLAVPALPDHLTSNAPLTGLGPDRALQLLVLQLKLPFALPVNPTEVTLLPVAVHPPSVTLTAAVSMDAPLFVSAGANLSKPVADVHETVPVASTGGVTADAGIASNAFTRAIGTVSKRATTSVAFRRIIHLPERCGRRERPPGTDADS